MVGLDREIDTLWVDTVRVMFSHLCDSHRQLRTNLRCPGNKSVRKIPNSNCYSDLIRTEWLCKSH